MNEIIIWLILALAGAAIIGLFMIGARLMRMQGQADSQTRQFDSIKDQQAQSREAQLKSLAEMQAKLEQRFGDMQQGIEKRLGEMSQTSIEHLAKSNDQIQETLHKRLTEISGQVETRLNKGFEKTNETFTDVVKRLALIDEAQKKITELSSSVVSLQEVLNDKRSRGAFGEAQMMLQVRNVLPEDSFAEQYKLSNGTRVDCMLFLPEPTGHLAIDAKFPLDSYKTMMNPDATQVDRVNAERQFKQDIKKHINDIAEKYIIPGETSDGALMFIPAEAVFAEIHAHQAELVEEAQRRRVWMVSPTTMMAVLTTARAVLKDSATRKQVHLIQEHLIRLSGDFDRFRKRMDNLSKHIQQANKDVEEVNTSARKISSRFDKIEKVELHDEDDIEVLEQ
ncbi:MAG: DNA recombination protein RmuC [Gammaproteobacteria bacterium]|nr:DNA recombination protein RmuC [Gammaproteobacteria bacterium]NNJ95532.1 DNA recombination protein RmuC [Gammaproteobacteria bacterium]